MFCCWKRKITNVIRSTETSCSEDINENPTTKKTNPSNKKPAYSQKIQEKKDVHIKMFCDKYGAPFNELHNYGMKEKSQNIFLIFLSKTQNKIKMILFWFLISKNS